MSESSAEIGGSRGRRRWNKLLPTCLSGFGRREEREKGLRPAKPEGSEEPTATASPKPTTTIDGSLKMGIQKSVRGETVTQGIGDGYMVDGEIGGRYLMGAGDGQRERERERERDLGPMRGM